MKKTLTGFYFLLLVAVSVPFITVSVANLAGLGWVMFKDELSFTNDALLILLFFVQVIIATRTFGLKGGLISCFFLGALISLQVINSPRSEDYFLGVAGIVGIGISVSLLLDQQEKGRKLLVQRIEERKLQAVELNRELTERKRAEETVKLAYAELDRIFNTTADAMCVIDVDFNMIRVNEASAALIGISKDEAAGKKCYEVFHSSLCYTPHCPLTQILNGKERVECEVEVDVESNNGITIPCLLAATPFWGSSGELIGIIENLNNITELKKTQEQLRHSQVMASLGEMTAGIAHEVNNPLGSILLYSELLLKDDVPRQAKKDLRVIHNEAKRAARIMTDLLTYGNGVKFQMRRLNLHKILTKVLNMRRYQQKVQNINVSANLLDDPLHVKGDSSQLMQVFMNLMLNAEDALKESKGSKIIISTEIDGDWAKVSIADNGIGIPEENLSLVFHPFFSTKGVGKGTGLGLSTCYGIITAHGGLIRAENNEMGGATFIVELPLAKARRRGSLRQETEKASLIIDLPSKKESVIMLEKVTTNNCSGFLGNSSMATTLSHGLGVPEVSRPATPLPRRIL